MQNKLGKVAGFFSVLTVRSEERRVGHRVYLPEK